MRKYRSRKPFDKRRKKKPTSTQRRHMLDMRREKYFRFDLGDMLDEIDLIENNKNTVAATILNKMSSKSMDEAFKYVDGLQEEGALKESDATDLKALLRRYSKWR